MSDKQPVLQVQHISKSFGGVHALQDVDFAVVPGEVHAILGENGAGKSTLIKILTGFHQPDSGEIFLEGRPVHFSGTREAQQLGIAAIYQEPSLFPDLDVAENIMVGRQPVGRWGIDWRSMYAEATGLLKRLGLPIDPHTKARDLSVAQQQVVEIARSLSINAKVLIMDEPTSSLTLREVDELFAIVRQLRDAGTAVVFISHRLEELFAVADRVTILRDGAYVGTREMAGISTDEMIRLMVGRSLGELFPKQHVEPGAVVLETEELGVEGVFSGVSFQLRRGEIVGMSGLIGAGRTNVARAIFGTDPATAGTIKLDGKPVIIKTPDEAMALGIGYVPEDRKEHGLVLEMSIADNITLPSLARFARWGWLNEGRALVQAKESSQQLEVKMTGVDQKAQQLSGGNQQKVVLAKWLFVNPKVLIVDEPTRGIDVGAKTEVHALLREVARNGAAVIVISSDLPEVLAVADRIIVLREGRISGELNGASASEETVLRLASMKSME